MYSTHYSVCIVWDHSSPACDNRLFPWLLPFHHSHNRYTIQSFYQLMQVFVTWGYWGLIWTDCLQMCLTCHFIEDLFCFFWWHMSVISVQDEVHWCSGKHWGFFLNPFAWWMETCLLPLTCLLSYDYNGVFHTGSARGSAQITSGHWTNRSI